MLYELKSGFHTLRHFETRTETPSKGNCSGFYKSQSILILREEILKISKETSRFNLVFVIVHNNVIFKEISERCLLYLHKVTIETKHTTSNVTKKRIGKLNCTMNQTVVM